MWNTTVNQTISDNGNTTQFEDEDDYVYDYDIDEALTSFDWEELGPSLCVYSITFLAGILGNLLILVSVFRNTHVKSSPVNVFLASLATADLLLIVICLPLKVFKLFTYTWTLGLLNCKLLYYMQAVSAIGSVINLTALSFERYYAIVHPLKSQYLCTTSKAKKTIGVAWISAFLLGIPVLFVQIHIQVGDRYKAHWCVRDIDTPLSWRVQEMYLLLIILIIPSVVMSFCYGRIIREVCQVVRQRSNLTQNYGKPSVDTGVPLREDPNKDEFTSVIERESNDEAGEETTFSLRPPSYENAMASPVIQTTNLTPPPTNSCSPGQRQKNRKESSSLKKVAVKVLTSVDQMGLCGKKSPKLDEDTKQVIRMLISIVLVYNICWGPILIFNLLQSFDYIGTNGVVLGREKYFKTAFSLMAYFNSCLNPIIYGFMSRNFRASFMESLGILWKCSRSQEERRQQLFRNGSVARSYSVRCGPMNSVATLPEQGHGRRLFKGHGKPSSFGVNIYTSSQAYEYARNYTVTTDAVSTSESPATT